MLQAILASLLAGLATGVGGLPVIFFKKIPERIYDALLGFAAGVMLSAASFTLIVPAIDEGGLYLALFGIAVGAAFVYFLETLIPHLEPHFSQKPLTLTFKRAILLALAITIHNLPEGLAVGVGYASNLPNLGLVIALAIAAQNMPEGLAVAAPLRQAGVSRFKSLFWATASGLAEPLAAFIGLISFGFIKSVVPFGLAFAGGAMIYVVSHELIPESHSHGFEKEATGGVVVGFLTMIFLQYILT
ncbi:MAG TPA: ZIP family metal transporter [Candidatus Subteraquimicrobiales bacterium]